MKLTDDFDVQKPVNMTLVNMALLMSVIVIGILGLVVWTNMPSKNATKVGSKVEASEESSATSEMMRQAEATKQTVDELISGSTLTSNDLDIWNISEYESGLSKNEDIVTSTSGDGVVSSKSDYQTNIAENSEIQSTADSSIADEGVPMVDGAQTREVQEINVGGTQNAEETAEATSEATETTDPSEDGKHTKVTYSNGAEEWIELNPRLTTNDYDLTKLMYEKPIMNYYVDGKRASYFGMDISKEQGVVDFNKFKKAGGEFVMLKLGGRGYSSGQIVIDDKFAEYAKSAEDAGLYIGTYFFSQAVTEKEAEEEAKTVIDALKGYKIKYPVVYRMETIGGDMTRVDDLTVAERTEVAKTFLEKIKSAGYIPMLYGDKEWLLTKYNLEELQDYEIWYVEDSSTPDYPYKFGMWQYSTSGAIDGVAGDIKLDISFKNYANM